MGEDAEAEGRSPFLSWKRWAGFAVLMSAMTTGLALLPTHPPPGDVEEASFTAVLPPLLAVALAAFFRQVLLALGAGVVLGSILAFGAELHRGAIDFVWKNVSDPFNLAIIGFTFALVGMVNVTNRSGGNHGLVEAVSRYAKSARSTRVVTGVLGLLIFFDDYANSVVVGTSMRSLSDSMRISRERLAYIVDSTAAPIAGVSLLSTWVAYEVGLFGEVGAEIGLERGGYALFLAVLPFRFYCMAALSMVFVGALSNRDYGPMLEAERRATLEGKVHADDAEPLGGDAFERTDPPEDAPRRWYNAVLPVGVVVLGVVGGMLVSGRGAVSAAGESFSVLSGSTWRLAFGGADSARVLLYASLGGSAAAILLAKGQGILTIAESSKAWLRTFPTMYTAVAVLILAWSIKSVCLDLGTHRYLLSVMGEVPLDALPLVIFGLAAATALATGTSFGTMGILLPVALPLAHTLGGESIELFLVGSAVLDGAIFGDHCSPISDTTVLSSAATGCDHVDHVRTQVPYAMTGMVIAATSGYLSLALGAPQWIPYLAIPAGAVAVFYVLGKRLPEAPSSGEEEAGSQGDAEAESAP